MAPECLHRTNLAKSKKEVDSRLRELNTVTNPQNGKIDEIINSWSESYRIDRTRGTKANLLGDKNLGCGGHHHEPANFTIFPAAAESQRDLLVNDKIAATDQIGMVSKRRNI